MKEPRRFSWHSRYKSFVFAVKGFRYFFYREHNAWLHAAATGAAIGFSTFFHISRLEWIAVLFAIAMVWVSEMVNTAIEKAMDHFSPGYHEDVGRIKDISAAAVLVAAVAAFIIGCIIFIPRFI
jgi:diacylglycerol kinase (ATP)